VLQIEEIVEVELRKEGEEKGKIMLNCIIILLLL